MYYLRQPIFAAYKFGDLRACVRCPSRVGGSGSFSASQNRRLHDQRITQSQFFAGTSRWTAPTEHCCPLRRTALRRAAPCGRAAAWLLTAASTVDAAHQPLLGAGARHVPASRTRCRAARGGRPAWPAIVSRPIWRILTARTPEGRLCAAEWACARRLTARGFTPDVPSTPTLGWDPRLGCAATACGITRMRKERLPEVVCEDP